MKVPKYIIMVLSLFSVLHAQASVSTNSVGYVTITIPSGFSILSIPLQKESLFTGSVTSVRGNTITADFGSLSSAFAYVQVIESSTAQGSIASVTNMTSTSIEVDPALPIAEGDRIVIRPHFLLSDIKGDPEFSDGTTLTLYPSDGTRESFEYISAATLGGQDGLWADSFSKDASDVAILPSEGFVFNNNSVESKVTLFGSVSINDVKILLGDPFTIVGSSSPLDTSTIASVFSDIAIGSTITVYSADGSLSIANSYEVVDSENLGLGMGKTYVRDGRFRGENDTILTGSGVVVNPVPDASELLIPPAFISEN